MSVLEGMWRVCKWILDMSAAGRVGKSAGGAGEHCSLP